MKENLLWFFLDSKLKDLFYSELYRTPWKAAQKNVGPIENPGNSE